LIKVVVAGACWGLSAVIAKIAFDRGVGPTRMAEARVVVAFVILSGLLAWRRPDLLRPPRGSLPLLVGFGVSVAAVNGSYYIAIDKIPVGVALSLQYTAPVLLLGLAALTGRRSPGRIAWVAAAATLAGSALVSRAFEGFRGVNAPGLSAGLASAVFFALYLLAADEGGRRGVHPATLLLWGFVFATVTWSVAAPWWAWPWGQLGQPQVEWAVLGVGVVGTLIPFFLAVGAVPVLSPATAGIAATVEPPFAAAFAWLFLGQRLSAVQVVGGVLVLVGVMVAQRFSALHADALTLETAP
jgi:drug/metabolite transporter (DMT)-like permease